MLMVLSVIMLFNTAEEMVFKKAFCVSYLASTSVKRNGLALF